MSFHICDFTWFYWKINFQIEKFTFLISFLLLRGRTFLDFNNSLSFLLVPS